MRFKLLAMSGDCFYCLEALDFQDPDNPAIRLHASDKPESHEHGVHIVCLKDGIELIFDSTDPVHVSFVNCPTCRAPLSKEFVQSQLNRTPQGCEISSKYVALFKRSGASRDILALVMARGVRRRAAGRPTFGRGHGFDNFDFVVDDFNFSGLMRCWFL